LLPSDFRIFRQKELASINCTLPARSAGFLLDRIQT